MDEVNKLLLTRMYEIRSGSDQSISRLKTPSNAVKPCLEPLSICLYPCVHVCVCVRVFRWVAALNRLVANDVRAALGVCTEVHAELHNLLIYPKGGKFLPHRDSEKSDHMFGTLVIALPSYHFGGDLLVHHSGETLTFSSSGKSKLLGPQWAAFYADCEHELQCVTEGFRVALVYNLCRKHNGITS